MVVVKHMTLIVTFYDTVRVLDVFVVIVGVVELDLVC
jgi:hypothetical protein